MVVGQQRSKRMQLFSIDDFLSKHLQRNLKLHKNWFDSFSSRRSGGGGSSGANSVASFSNASDRASVASSGGGGGVVGDLANSGGPRYKTSLCRDFTAHGSCPRGKNCTFAHSVSEMDQFRGHGRPVGNANGKNKKIIRKRLEDYSQMQIEKRVMVAHLGFVLCLKRVMTVHL